MKIVQLLRVNDRDGELPAVMVKKAASRAENMADAEKIARCVQTDKKREICQRQQKIVNKSGDSTIAVIGSQGQRGRRVCLHLFFVCRKAVFAPRVALQSGLCHIHLNGEEQNKFRQFVARGYGSKKGANSCKGRVLGAAVFCGAVWGKVCTGRFSDRGGDNPPQCKGWLLHKLGPAGKQGS